MHSTNEISSAPALSRGIAVLRILQVSDADGLTLDVLAKKTQVPKASLLRILETLGSSGLVCRTPSGTWKGLVQLVPIAGHADHAERIGLGLKNLAHHTGHTAEWWIADDRGMVLVDRREPPVSEVCVRARVGFVRTWSGEIDSVAALGHAYLKPGRPGSAKGCWVYGSDGKQRSLNTDSFRKIIEDARTRNWLADTCTNSNGVVRLATLVQSPTQETAVLSLAFFVTHGAIPDSEPLLNLLRQSAAIIAGERMS
jgi:DNA-binding IclR family transcriptional regulator